MAALELADDTYLAVSPTLVAAAIREPASWLLWWPDLSLVVRRDRGSEGIEWTVSGPVAGSMEIWLEDVEHGTVLHWLLRADLALAGRRVARERERRIRSWKVHAFALKDRLEWAERVM